MKSGFLFAAVLASIACLISGCDGVSRSDKRFVAATMPPAFDTFRMYSQGDPSSARQACMATIRTPFGDTREAVVLERGSGITFDIAATRDGLEWDVSSDGLAPTDIDSPVFRYLLVDCVSALQDKYRAEPAGVTNTTLSPLHR